MKKIIYSLFLCFSLFSKAEGLSPFKGKEPSAGLTLKIKLGGGTAADTLIVHFFSRYYPIEDSLPEKDKYLILQNDGFYHIAVQSESPYGYFALSRKNNPANFGEIGFADTWLTKIYYWEAGDNITINLKLMPSDTLFQREKRSHYLIQFIGKGSRKYRVSVIAQNELLTAHFNYHKKPDSVGVFRHTQYLGILRACQTLDRNRFKISKSAYYVLKADILFFNSEAFYRDIKQYYWNVIMNKGDVESAGFRMQFDSVFKSMYATCGIPDKYLARSRWFPKYCVGGIETKGIISLGRKTENDLYDIVSLDSIYFVIKSSYNEFLKDKLLAYSLYYPGYYKAINYSILLDDAMQIIKTKAYKDMVRGIFNTRSGGSSVYNFDLIDSSGKTVALSNFKGKTVLIDFYFNGCGACSHYYNTTLKQVERTLESNKSIVFLSISADDNIHAFKSGLRSGKYCSSNSIPLFTKGEGANSPIIKYYKIVGFPTVILINSDGKIVEYNSKTLYDEDKLVERLTQLTEKKELSRL